jgi:quercetin dioxygenase-like cupin family protein
MEMLFEHYPPKINSLRRYKKDIQRISRLHCPISHFTRRCIITLHTSSRFTKERFVKRKLFITLAIVGTLCFAGQFFTTAAHRGAQDKNAFTPDTIQWGPPPPFIAPGAQVAVIEGNPGASTGDYTVRVKMPDGYRIAPHWHPLRENVTVISGTFKVGMGDTFDRDKMATFPAGSFAYLDPDMHHYAMASGEVIIQIHGVAPMQFNYIHPEDDPGKK